MQLTINIPDNFLIAVKEKQEDFIKTMLFNHALVLYQKNGIVKYVEFLIFIYLNNNAKKPETYRKLTMPINEVIL